MSGHTPRPWKAVYIGSGDWDLDGPVTREDWVLAAAAPDLLEALKSMVEIAELTIGFLPTPPNADGPLIQARAAIAKAERSKR